MRSPPSVITFLFPWYLLNVIWKDFNLMDCRHRKIMMFLHIGYPILPLCSSSYKGLWRQVELGGQPLNADVQTLSLYLEGWLKWESVPLFYVLWEDPSNFWHQNCIEFMARFWGSITFLQMVVSAQFWKLIPEQAFYWKCGKSFQNTLFHTFSAKSERMLENNLEAFDEHVHSSV
jgi:hypothetical protein